MARKSDLFLNFERIWREMDELLGEPWADRGRNRAPRLGAGFSPKVDVFYCADDEGPSRPEQGQPKAVVLVELPGIDAESVRLEVAGRDLIVTGERAVQQTEGRVYQQVEIEAGGFRRVIELGADVIAERAEASYDDGILKVELPLRAAQVATRVPIGPKEHSGD